METAHLQYTYLEGEANLKDVMMVEECADQASFHVVQREVEVKYVEVAGTKHIQVHKLRIKKNLTS